MQTGLDYYYYFYYYYYYYCELRELISNPGGLRRYIIIFLFYFFRAFQTYLVSTFLGYLLFYIRIYIIFMMFILFIFLKENVFFFFFFFFFRQLLRLQKNSYPCVWRGGICFSVGFCLFWYQKHMDFNVWKIYSEALRIIVHLMGVDAGGGTKLSITNCVNM